MITSQATVSLREKGSAKQIADTIKESLAGSGEFAQVTEYSESIKIPDVNDGKRFYTGRKTIVILVGGGDPDIKIEVLKEVSGCC